jgi:hypothetical protein
LKAEVEARQKAEAERRQAEEENTKRKAEEDARRKEEEARREAAEEARRQAEAEAQRQAEAARKKAEDEARQREEEQQRAEEEEQLRAEHAALDLRAELDDSFEVGCFSKSIFVIIDSMPSFRASWHGKSKRWSEKRVQHHVAPLLPTRQRDSSSHPAQLRTTFVLIHSPHLRHQVEPTQISV